MKCIPALLLIAAVLTGCAAQASSVQDASGVSQGAVTESVSLYDPNSAVEADTQGAVRSFPLGGACYEELFFLGDNLALLACEEDSTTMVTLSPETGNVLSSARFPFRVSTADPSFLCLNGGFSVYDPAGNEIHRFDGNLQPLTGIPAPEDITGPPILSADGTTLYYCTPTAIRALDISSGISRVIKEAAYPGQVLSGLHAQETVLYCTYAEEDGQHALFLSTQNGSTLYLGQDVRQLITTASRHYALLQQGNQTAWVFGDGEGTKQMLLTDSEIQILPQMHSAIEISRVSDRMVSLDCISLDTGYRTASVRLPSGVLPAGFTASDNGRIWFLGDDPNDGGSVLYCWDPALSAIADRENHVTAYSPRSAPDTEAISQCAEYAQSLSSRYGIEILVYEQAVQVQPQHCRLTHEHQAPVIMKELKQLDKGLGGYPEGFLQTIEGRFDGLTICLVRSLSGSCGPQEAADGLQFWDGNHAYIALAPGAGSQRALYHGLCHLIDTIVLNTCSAYDTWNQLNPTGFEYDYDYTANSQRNSTAYLLDTNRYFVDMFSMSFPKEDRARIMEYAMTPGNEGLFQTDAMQSKLTTLCWGIREAFGLEDREETFLWEQYLHTPLAQAG